MYLSFTSSDYITECFIEAPNNPKTAISYIFCISGSSNNDISKIIVDLDGVVVEKFTNPYVSYKTLDIPYNKLFKHYWAISGYLLKKFEDVSPAYITGYLIERDLQEELQLFRSLYNKI
jgi:hypothetical protein